MIEFEDLRSDDPGRRRPAGARPRRSHVPDPPDGGLGISRSRRSGCGPGATLGHPLRHHARLDAPGILLGERDGVSMGHLTFPV